MESLHKIKELRPFSGGHGALGMSPPKNGDAKGSYASAPWKQIRICLAVIDSINLKPTGDINNILKQLEGIQCLYSHSYFLILSACHSTDVAKY